MGDTSKPRGLILVIDDDADLREMYGDLLGSQNYRFAVARDGEVGLRLVQELRPDAVLLDMMMPDCDGLEFLARLQQECPSPRPPVIASSGFSAFEKEALARGAAVFLSKPIDSSAFLVILDDLLNGKTPEPESLTRLGEHALAARQRASVHREELWTKFDLSVPEQRLRLEALVLRMSNYFAPATVLVTLVKEGDFLVLASSGDGISAGTLLRRDTSLCTDVVEGGSSMVLGDTTTHACFATHPDAQSGYRFYACAPLTGSDGVAIGTLSVQDRRPRAFHAEDLLILEHIALGVARRMEALAGFGTVGPFLFDEPGIFSREALYVLLGAELGRSARHGGTVELALIELDQERPELRQQCASADGGPLGGERFAVANYGKGVLALLRGAGDDKVVRRRIEQALGEIRRSGAGMRGAGIVTYALSGSAALGEREVAHLADEARVRAVSTGSGVEHVVLSGQSGGGATRHHHFE
jgi:CheY-like chemotaxis protein